MELLPKPRHPDLDKCSREECQTMIDMASVRTASSMSSKYDEKLDRFKSELNTRVDLMISNAILKLKDELRTLNNTTLDQLRKEIDELRSSTGGPDNVLKINENSKNLEKLRGNVQKLYDAFNER